MNAKKLKCIIKNFLYTLLICICAIVGISSVLILMSHFISELGVLIFLLIVLTVAIICASFDVCR